MTKSGAWERQSPPFANGAKGGTPSSTWGGRRCGSGAGVNWCADHAGFVNGKLGGQIGYLFADFLFDRGVTDVAEDFGDPGADQLHLGFFHATRGDGRTAQANAARLHRGERIERNGIFVDGDARAIESFFRVASGDAARMDFDQEEMIIRAPGDDAEARLAMEFAMALALAATWR